MSKVSERVQLLHPEGKNAPTISTENYTLFEKAILDVLNRASVALSWTEIEQGVRHYLSEHKIAFEGSPGWFAVSIKLHLEATGVIESFSEKGRKLHRLKK